MRRSTSAFLGVVLVGVVGFIVLAWTTTTRDAFSLNAPRSTPAVVVKAGQEACQTPVDVPVGGAFNAVNLQIGTYHRPGPAIDVSVHDQRGRVLARRTFPAGYPDLSRPDIDLGQRFDGRGYRVCFRNRGPHKIAIYGTGGAAVGYSEVEIDGEAVPFDMALVFKRDSHSVGSIAGTIGDRATLFRSPRLSGTVYIGLLVLLLAAAGGGLFVALRRSEPVPSSDEADRTA